MYLTDPEHDKKRIEESKGGLLGDSCRWILDHADFQRWRNDPQSRLLWVKGDPGKGKTMLMCGSIDELKKSSLVSFFLCQATDSRINNGIAVLRGLIYSLVAQQPPLINLVRKSYDVAGKALFETPNAWVALSGIFTDILRDPNLKLAYLIIDALDECVTGLPQLLELIVQSLSSSICVKWLLSSRNEPDIERQLRLDDARARLSLELKDNEEHVSHAVKVYIDDKVAKMESLQDDDQLRDQVRVTLHRKANDTFLWIALVVQELERVNVWEVEQVLEEVPTGLDALYARMMSQIQQLERRNPEFCQQVLSATLVTYRPLHLLELGMISGLPQAISKKADNVLKIVSMCGSFLTIQDSQVYFIHQSAKDYLLDKASITLFPSGTAKTHRDIFTQSLALMSRILKRDMYSLNAPGFPIGEVSAPEMDPLTSARYSCVHWVDHLCDSKPACGGWLGGDDDLQDGGTVQTFLEKKYLYWLEALSLRSSMSEGVIAIKKLEELVSTEAV